MKRSLILTFILIMSLSAVAMASDTRVMTMGENNMILLDEANIGMFPSRIMDYPSLAIAEFDDSYGQEFTRFGVHWKFNKDNPWVLGTYFTENPDFFPSYYVSGTMPNNFTFFPNGDNRRIDLFYGREMGNNNFGFSFTYSQASAEVPTGGTEGVNELGFMLGLTPNSGQWDISTGLLMGGFTDEDVDGNIEYEPDGYYDFAVMGRYFMNQNPNYTYVPHAMIMMGKRGAKDGATPNNGYVEKMLGIDAGFGINYTPANNVLAVLDIGLMYAKISSDATTAGTTVDGPKDTYMHLPYFKLGLDADVFKWLDVRFGATSFWSRDKYDDGTGDEWKWNEPYNDTYLGFGFHWNRLHLDTYANPELFLEGFNFISNGSEQMNFKISAVYEMM